MLRRVVMILMMPIVLAAQDRGRRAAQAFGDNLPYDGSFIFTRIQYGSNWGGGWGFRRGAAWAHDYPQADRNMPRILDFITSMRANLQGSNVITLDDPRLYQFPIIYLSEPGFWSITESEAQNLRNYLLRGGFIIFDDFEADQWYNFEAQLGRALPEYEFIELDASHPIFHCFFDLDRIDVPHPYVRVQPHYYGIFEDNDPTKRMMVMVNYNADLAEYWEYSGTGFFPVDITNDAYKLGVNYIIWAMTH
jgi:hypothetical protein